MQELTQLCGGGADGGAEGTSGGAAAGAAAAPAAAAADAEALDPEAALEGSHVAIFKRTRAALHMLSDMQAGASTPSTLLPAPAAGAAADAAAPPADGGKKQRTSAEGWPRHGARGAGSQQQSGSAGSQQLEVEAH